MGGGAKIFLYTGVIFNRVPPPISANYWIGLSDSIQEGHYLWQSTQDNVDFTDWAPGEPNDNHHTEDCAELFQPFSFHWNDAPCSVKSNFICEKT